MQQASSRWTTRVKMDGRFTILSFLLFPPPDVDDVNSAIAGAARNCRRDHSTHFQGRTLSIFVLCNFIENEFFIHLGSLNCRLLTRCFQLFFFLRIVKLPFHKVRLTIEEFYLRILFEELK